MRAVIDTNVFISALFWSGRPRQVVDLAALGGFQAITSAELLAELQDVLANDFDVPPERLDLILRDILAYAEVVLLTHDPEPQPQVLASVERVLRDPDDLEVISAALSGGAQCIVTGDRDLLALQEVAGIVVVPPAQFLDLVGSEGMP
jgi:putative PIN family toxin of toxin-antitoxin system